MLILIPPPSKYLNRCFWVENGNNKLRIIKFSRYLQHIISFACFSFFYEKISFEAKEKTRRVRVERVTNPVKDEAASKTFTGFHFCVGDGEAEKKCFSQKHRREEYFPNEPLNRYRRFKLTIAVVFRTHNARFHVGSICYRII